MDILVWQVLFVELNPLLSIKRPPIVESVLVFDISAIASDEVGIPFQSFPDRGKDFDVSAGNHAKLTALIDEFL